MNRNMTDDVIYCDFAIEDSFYDDEYYFLERSDEDQSINEVSGGRITTKQLVRQAANDPALVPIPEYVLNDAVRNIPLTREMEFFFFTNGEYENLVLTDVQIRERELKIKSDFQKWLTQRDLTIPECFAEDNDDIRFYFASGRDFQ